jgi:hypothetical protein
MTASVVNDSSHKDDVCWRKSRLAARIVMRSRAGALTGRDRRLGALLKADPDVTSRLMHQAIAALQARQFQSVR